MVNLLTAGKNKTASSIIQHLNSGVHRIRFLALLICAFHVLVAQLRETNADALVGQLTLQQFDIGRQLPLDGRRMAVRIVSIYREQHRLVEINDGVTQTDSGHRVVHRNRLGACARSLIIHLQHHRIRTGFLENLRGRLTGTRSAIAEVPSPIFAILSRVAEPHRLTYCRLLGGVRKFYFIRFARCNQHQNATYPRQFLFHLILIMVGKCPPAKINTTP